MLYLGKSKSWEVNQLSLVSIICYLNDLFKNLDLGKKATKIVYIVPEEGLWSRDRERREVIDYSEKALLIAFIAKLIAKLRHPTSVL